MSKITATPGWRARALTNPAMAERRSSTQPSARTASGSQRGATMVDPVARITRLGARAKNGFDVRFDAELELRARALRRCVLIIEDAAQRFAAGQERAQPHLAADLARTPEDRDPMPALGSHPRRFETGHACAHHDDAPALRCLGRPVVDFVGERDARIVVACDRRPRHVEPPARVAGDAIADVVRAVCSGLVHPGRIRHQRTAQADQLGFAACQDALGFGRIGDPSEGDDGYRRQCLSQLLEKRHVRRARAVPVGHMHFERAGVAALGEAQILHRASAQRARARSPLPRRDRCCPARRRRPAASGR